MTLNELLIHLCGKMKRSPYYVQLSIMQDCAFNFGTIRDEHIRRLIIQQTSVKRWAVYNDESEIIIELEG